MSVKGRLKVGKRQETPELFTETATLATGRLVVQRQTGRQSASPFPLPTPKNLGDSSTTSESTGLAIPGVEKPHPVWSQSSPPWIHRSGRPQGTEPGWK